MEENQLKSAASKAYAELLDQAAKTKKMVEEQTLQKRCNVMTKYLTGLGFTKVGVDALPLTIDGITFDVIPEQRDPHPIQPIRTMLPAYVTVLTPCPHCAKDVWTVVPDGELAGLGEVLQPDFVPHHKCPDQEADGPDTAFQVHKLDDVVTWGSLTEMLLRLKKEFPSVFGDTK